MSGRLTIWIDGREALPVRAIPYVEGWLRFSPDVVARYLARDDDLVTEWDIPLAAYHQPDGELIEVHAREWDSVVASIAGFAEEAGDGDAGYALWRKSAAEKLPAGVFVWLNEFESVFSSLCKKLDMDDTRPDVLMFTPVLSDEARQMVLEGFASGDSLKGGAGETACDEVEAVTNPIATITTNRLQTRTDILAAVIKVAKNRAVAPDDSQSVWAIRTPPNS